MVVLYDSKGSFSNYRNIRKYYDLSFMKKYDRLSKFYHWLIEFRTIVAQTEETKS